MLRRSIEADRGRRGVSIPTAGKAIVGANGLVNSVSFSGCLGALLQQILAQAAAKTVVLAMGNPYLAQDFSAH